MKKIEFLKENHVSFDTGVLSVDVQKIRSQFGSNKIESKKENNFLDYFIEQLKNPLNLILILAGFFTLFLGEHLDTYVIFAAVLINMFISIFQESKTNKTFKKLNQSKKFDVLVRRDSQKTVIQADELVVGDIVFLQAGDKVPADMKIIEENIISIDESSFTGESRDIHKEPSEILFSGTLIKRGSAVGVVTAVGINSEFGKILVELEKIQKKPSSIEEKMKKLTLFIGGIALIATAFVVIGGVYSGLPLHALVTLGVSIAISAIPEGLAASVSASLSVAMYRLMKKGILVKDLVSTETMASIDTILTDKTGTLTEGNMSLRKIFLNKDLKINEDTFLEYAYLASDVSYDFKNKQFVGDEMDIAIVHKLEKNGGKHMDIESKYKTLKILPFSSEERFFAKLVQEKRTKKMFVFIKGAGEKILEKSINLSDDSRKEYRDFLHKEQNSENRFLAFAYKNVDSNIDIDTYKLTLDDIEFSGFGSFLDPLKDSVHETLSVVKDMDLNLIMITGDSKEVAIEVAKKSGLVISENSLCLEGSDIDRLSKDELYKICKDVKVFARVSPKSKLKLAETFIENGHRIAMTGDGVNDVLALSMADIGITFANASEAAREAASLVLVKNDFSLILTAIDEARNVIKNLRKTVVYLLSSSFSEIIVILFAMLLGGPMPFLAVHILWANIVEEGLINFAFIFGENKKSTKSGKVDSNILTKKVKKLTFLLGIFDGLLLLGLYLFLWKSGFETAKIQSLMFLALSLNFAFVAYALTDLENSILKTKIFANKYLNLSVLAGLSLLSLAIFWSPLRSILKLEIFSLVEVMYLVLFSFVYLIVVELLKYFFIIRENKKH